MSAQAQGRRLAFRVGVEQPGYLHPGRSGDMPFSSGWLWGGGERGEGPGRGRFIDKKGMASILQPDLGAVQEGHLPLQAPLLRIGIAGQLQRPQGLGGLGRRFGLHTGLILGEVVASQVNGLWQWWSHLGELVFRNLLIMKVSSACEVAT